ncbi:hypothetical protein BKA82DRAFT_143905 [Pisolithus tinctorius]|uniref:Uncharacterized protein n=1 Tax=Pisolithus tinctorius Marx 270 TaxID=870435 RepID=A0A0C3P939_PISTI|nr:hypothetical protein BKA82DRAFT_143905 [Pisolithus tinctorius]KIO04256.1 hypothetical protein M404DRAFT_143905 [Pisolithus tinctorius Marx 270]
MLSVLRNDWLPLACLPQTYNLAKYSGAILCPHGMHCLHDVVHVWMCLSCHKLLMVRTPLQPKDAMANFQYYMHVELPQEVQDSIGSASSLELMLVAACCATVITHHYQTKSI